MNSAQLVPDGPPSAAPLAGIKVADFSRVLAGPFATMMLADFGADVIKVESPAGDDTRAWVPPVDEHGAGTYFSSVNRNKRSVVCDLRTEEGLAQARDIALAFGVPPVLVGLPGDATYANAREAGRAWRGRWGWRVPRHVAPLGWARAHRRRPEPCGVADPLHRGLPQARDPVP